jgi:hypothetical protein
MVLKNQPWWLEVAAKLPIQVSRLPPVDSVQLVESVGELMLAHQEFGDKSYDVYQVDLDNVTLCRVKSFGGGGHACSLVSMLSGLSQWLHYIF